MDIKIKNRREDAGLETPNYFLLVEHPHVYTLGKSGDLSNLLISEEKLAKIGATFYKINRGGDITYHGPGQIVGYPIIDLENFFTDIHKYPKLEFTLNANPCIVTQRLARTPKAQILRAKGVPTSNHTPVSPFERSALIPYSAKVRMTISSKKRRYL